MSGASVIAKLGDTAVSETCRPPSLERASRYARAQLEVEHGDRSVPARGDTGMIDGRPRLTRFGALQCRPPSLERVSRMSSCAPCERRASCQAAYSVPRPSTANDGTCGERADHRAAVVAAGVPVANRRAALQCRPPSVERETRYQAGRAGVA